MQGMARNPAWYEVSLGGISIGAACALIFRAGRRCGRYRVEFNFGEE